MVFAFFGIAALSFGVWAHHMFATGLVYLPYFSIMSLLIAVPTGIKVFNWIGTMWRGSITLSTAMLMALGFILVFLIGGITGVFLASPPIDFAVNDTYFHRCTSTTSWSAGCCTGCSPASTSGSPSSPGGCCRSGSASWQFWIFLVGFNLTFFFQFLVGLDGMPRRIADYQIERWGRPTSPRPWGRSSPGCRCCCSSGTSWSRSGGAPAGDDPWEGNSLSG